MNGLFEQVIKKCKQDDFLEAVRKKAHYDIESVELLGQVLGRILEQMEGLADWSMKEPADAESMERQDVEPDGATPRLEVVMTLGAGVDKLQAEYIDGGMLTEAYMVEVLGSEILLVAYGEFNAYVRTHTDCVVERYYFLGDEKYPLSGLPKILENSGLSVRCTEGYCMVPKKSVAFIAGLTKDRQVVCQGICVGCGRTDCPNRMRDTSKNAMAPDHPLTYGYARIFGL